MIRISMKMELIRKKRQIPIHIRKMLMLISRKKIPLTTILAKSCRPRLRCLQISMMITHLKLRKLQETAKKLLFLEILMMMNYFNKCVKNVINMNLKMKKKELFKKI